MVYQRKKRAYEQEQQQHIPQPQPSLFTSPDLETDETDNAFSVDSSQPGPSMEVRHKQASNPLYTLDTLRRKLVYPPSSAVQRRPESPLMQATQTDNYWQRVIAGQGAPRLMPQTGKPAVQRDVMADEAAAQKAPEGGAGGAGAVELTPRGSGRPLPKQVSDNFVQSGYPEVQQARVHVDDAATQSIQAHGYTMKNDIVVQSSGANDPKLLAHEATHVVQQSQMALKPDVNGTPINASPALEKNADDNSERVARNEPVKVEGVNLPDQPGEIIGGAALNQSVQRQMLEPQHQGVIQRLLKTPIKVGASQKRVLGEGEAVKYIEKQKIPQVKKEDHIKKAVRKLAHSHQTWGKSDLICAVKAVAWKQTVGPFSPDLREADNKAQKGQNNNQNAKSKKAKPKKAKPKKAKQQHILDHPKQQIPQQIADDDSHPQEAILNNLDNEEKYEQLNQDFQEHDAEEKAEVLGDIENNALGQVALPDVKALDKPKHQNLADLATSTNNARFFREALLNGSLDLRTVTSNRSLADLIEEQPKPDSEKLPSSPIEEGTRMLKSNTYKKQHPSLAKVDKKDLLSTAIYTRGYAKHYQPYVDINDALRHVDPNTAYKEKFKDNDELLLELLQLYQPYILGISAAINNLPPYKGRCFRGGNMPPEKRNQYKKGDVVTEAGFTSATINTIKTFSGNTYYVIDSLGGGAYISPVSDKGAEEQEVLFPHNSKFKVINVHGFDGGDSFGSAANAADRFYKGKSKSELDSFAGDDDYGSLSGGDQAYKAQTLLVHLMEIPTENQTERAAQYMKENAGSVNSHYKRVHETQKHLLGDSILPDHEEKVEQESTDSKDNWTPGQAIDLTTEIPAYYKRLKERDQAEERRKQEDEQRKEMAAKYKEGTEYKDAEKIRENKKKYSSLPEFYYHLEKLGVAELMKNEDKVTEEHARIVYDAIYVTDKIGTLIVADAHSTHEIDLTAYPPQVLVQLKHEMELARKKSEGSRDERKAMEAASKEKKRKAAEEASGSETVAREELAELSITYKNETKTFAQLVAQLVEANAKRGTATASNALRKKFKDRGLRYLIIGETTFDLHDSTVARQEIKPFIEIWWNDLQSKGE
ncbi:MAG: DUF4157 domain-containing protein [Cyanobacteria bacterium P01_A01_bin.123]